MISMHLYKKAPISIFWKFFTSFALFLHLLLCLKKSASKDNQPLRYESAKMSCLHSKLKFTQKKLKKFSDEHFFTLSI